MLNPQFLLDYVMQVLLENEGKFEILIGPCKTTDRKMTAIIQATEKHPDPRKIQELYRCLLDEFLYIDDAVIDSCKLTAHPVNKKSRIEITVNNPINPIQAMLDSAA